MSRDELSALDRAELDALDRIVAREPVGEEHLELAALVESVRADAPAMEPEFAARLDAEMARRLAAPRRIRLPAVNVRRLALAGGGFAAAAVALAFVITSGVLQGGRTTAPGPTLSPPAHVAPSSGAEARHVPSAPAPDIHTTPNHPVSATPANTTPAPGSPAGAGKRLVHSTAALELATPARSVPRVADRVVALTERAGGVVASSFVHAQGAASRASFNVRVPSRRLAPLIAELSSLASVRSLTQNTNDVTSGYDRAVSLLSRRRAERAALRRRLANTTTTTTTAQQDAIKRRIGALDALILGNQRSAAALAGQAHTATLHVDVVVGAAPKGAAGGRGGSPLDGASRTALHALEQLLAVALVALAIALPVALCALALWWVVASLRQRARERAIRAA